MDYTIQPGDTLAAIANRFGVTLSQLLAANPQITNSNLIFAGQRITIPETTPAPSPGNVARTYIIRPGDTLFSIASRFGTTVNTLIGLNPGINPNRLIPGQQIRIPVTLVVTPPGCIVYVSTRGGQPDLWRSNATGRNAVRITRGSGTAAQPVSNPQWSPNGKFIAYQAVGGLFIIDPCGRRPFRVADNVLNYSWSNDSSRLAYANNEGAFIVNLRGQITKVTNNLGNPAWFPGDTRLAGYATPDEGIRFPHLVTADVSGANYTVIEPLIPANVIRLSPSGRYAATQTFQGFAYGIFQTLTIYDFSTGTRTDLPGLEIPVRPDVVRNVSFLGGWSPDSSRLVYSTITSLNGQGEIRIASPRGKILQRFLRSFYPIPKWGPSNDWIVYTLSGQPGTEAYTPATPRNIYIRNIRTNQETKITSLGDNYSPDWNSTVCLPC